MPAKTKTRKSQVAATVTAIRPVENDRLSPTQKKLEAALTKWQQRLRVQDWNITVSLERRTDFQDFNCYAEIDYFTPNKSATIKILDPIDIVDEHHETPLAQYDWERSLIHELIHLLLLWIPKTDSDKSEVFDCHVDEELTINILSQALIKMDRELTA